MSSRSHVQIKPNKNQSYTNVSENFLSHKKKPFYLNKRNNRLTKPIHRYSENPSFPEIIPPVVHDVLHQPGKPLNSSDRSCMEFQFGHDFSQVRIHTNNKASESARSVNAQAYTVGNNIVFSKGLYAPQKTQGRGLLAHELTHYIQQKHVPQSYSPQCQLNLNSRNSTAEREADTIADRIVRPEIPERQNERPLSISATPQSRLQRAVSPDMPKIKDYLSYDFWGFDWVITDEEASKALDILEDLKDADLKDTVAEMEKEGLVENLYDNVSDEDQANREKTLQRIHNFRVHKKEVKEGKKTVTKIGSCSFEEKETIDSKVNKTKEWARKSKEAIDNFLKDSKRYARVKNLLDIHFFHQEKAGTLSEADQKKHAKDIRGNFEKTEKQKDPFLNVCASPFDQLCSALAAAYVSYGKKTVMFCPCFFKKDDKTQTYMLLHEFVHVYTWVDDKGYGDERVFAYLSPNDSKNNADSYALFALDIVKTPGGAEEMRFRAIPKDIISDCSDDQAKEIRRGFASVARMIKEALNNLGVEDITSKGVGKTRVETHFKTSNRKELQQVIKRFKKINEKIKEPVNFECESSCNEKTIGYYYSVFGWTSHICPAFFKLSTPKEREDGLLLMVISERLGMGQKSDPGTESYKKETKKDSYNNPWAYVAYAREVS